MTNGFPTSTPSPFAPFTEITARIKQEKFQCEKAGGRWDPVTNTCTLPDPPSPPGSILTEADTGEDVGFLDSKGNFVKADAETIQNIRSKQEGGGITSEEFQSNVRLRKAIKLIGKKGPLTPAEQAEVNWLQAVTAGGANVIPGVLGGAAAGAVVGGVAGAGVGAIPGAIIGGLAGGVGTFASGVLGNVKEQQRGELAAARIELTLARTNMRQLAMLASQNPEKADIYIKLYNDQLTRVYQSRRQTHLEVQGVLNSWMEDGREQGADFDGFLQEGGTAEIYALKLENALERGIPLTLADFEGIRGEEELIS